MVSLHQYLFIFVSSVAEACAVSMHARHECISSDGHSRSSTCLDTQFVCHQDIVVFGSHSSHCKDAMHTHARM